MSILDTGLLHKRSIFREIIFVDGHLKLASRSSDSCSSPVSFPKPHIFIAS